MAEDHLAPIGRAFAEGTPIDEALEAAVLSALKRHKQAGNPIVVWQNGKLRWLSPEKIPIDSAND